MTKDDWERKLGKALDLHLGRAVADWLVNLRCQDEVGNDHADAAALHLFQAGAEWAREEAAGVCDQAQCTPTCQCGPSKVARMLAERIRAGADIPVDQITPTLGQGS